MFSSNRNGIENYRPTTDFSGELIAWMIFLIGIFSSWATYKQFGLALTYVTLPAFICLGVMVLSLLSGRRLKIELADYCVFGMFAICFFSQLWTLSESSWLQQFFWYSICFIVYFSVRFFVTSLSRIRLVIYGVLVGGLIGCLLITTQTDDYGNVLDRQSIEDVNANFTAYILAGTCYLGICFYKLRWSSRWFGYTLILLNILTFIKIDFLGTRGALISLVAIWTWLIFYRFVSRRMTILMIFAAFGACILFTLGVFDDLLLYIDDLSNRGTGDLSGRLPVWQFAKQLISENPVWGIGIGSFEAVNPFGIGAHNIFLTFMLEMGSVGLLLFMVFLYSLFFPARNNGMLSYRKFLLGAFFCFWLPIAVSGHWELAPFSWLLLGVTFNLMRFSWENTVIA